MSATRLVLNTKNLIKVMAAGDRVIKSLAIFSFILLMLTLFVIINIGPATRYEISIYTAYPWYFWVFLIGSIACGISAMVYYAFYGNEKSNWWLFAFLAVILANIAFLLLPFFRGYLVYGRGDVMTHIGYLKDLIARGSTGGENYYPIMHIFSSTLSNILNLDIRLVTTIFSPIFSIFYMVSVYLLATTLTTDKRKAVFITVFGLIPMYADRHSIFSAGPLVFFLFPFIAFLYFKSRVAAARAKATNYTILFIMLLVLVPFFHAMVALWLVIVLLCLELPKLFLYRMAGNGESRGEIQRMERFSLTPPLMEFVVFFVWFSTFAVFTWSVRGIAQWLLEGAGKTQVEIYTGVLQRGQVSTYEFLDLLFRWHGSTILYFVVSAIACVLILRALLSPNKPKPQLSYLAFSIMFIVFNMLGLLILFGSLIIGVGRVQPYAIFAATVLNGLVVYDLGTSNKFIMKPINTKVLASCVTAFLILALVIGTFAVHMAPNTKRHNQQVTYGEWSGMAWFIQVRAEKLFISDTLVERWRWCDALYGFSGRADVSTYFFRQERILPDHFNYDQGGNLGQAGAYGEANSYLLINRVVRIFYQGVYPKHPEYARWTLEDFKNLENDPSVDKVFANKELEVWTIYNRASGYSD